MVVSLDLELWTCLLGWGSGVASARESVLGGEDRSTLGPASDIRGRIRVLLVRGQDGGEMVQGELAGATGRRRDVTRLNQERCGSRLDGGSLWAVGTCLFRNHPSRIRVTVLVDSVLLVVRTNILQCVW